jgi:signal transduction histidine kinase
MKTSIRKLQERIGELEAANKRLVEMRSVEKFAATGRISRIIAHEVRNPLTNINLAVEQLQIEFKGKAAGIGDTLLAMISRNSDRINLLITDLLNSTKFEELRYQHIGVNKLLDETLELATERIELNHFTVIKTYTGEVCIIPVDVNRMKTAFLNVVVNALEAMEAGKGVLTVTTAARNNKCMVTIADNGVGIEEEALSKVFEPYFTSKPTAAGLGLTNSQNIVLNHNGMISLESQKGAGTTCTIQLEMARGD